MELLLLSMMVQLEVKTMPPRLDQEWMAYVESLRSGSAIEASPGKGTPAGTQRWQPAQRVIGQERVA